VYASLLADMGKTDEAAAQVRSLLDGRRDRETWLALAQIYEKGKNWDEGAKALEEAQKLSTGKQDQNPRSTSCAGPSTRR
jgi:predicted Zn-dependent protease